MKEKQFKRSPLTVVFYVLAGVMAVYFLYSVYSAVTYLGSYFESYGTSVSDNLSDAVMYVLSAAVTPLVNACVLFGIGLLHNEVRKNNPDNYVDVKAPAKEADSIAAVEETASEATSSEEATAEATTEEAAAEATAEAATEEAAAEATVKAATDEAAAEVR